MTPSRLEAVTALVTHPACLDHETPPGHPERPARLEAVLEALAGDEFHALRREKAPRARLGELARVHSRSYIKHLFAMMPDSGFAMIDADTALSAGSREAALRAAGAVIRAVDLVISGEIQNAFCAVRPPGHHAGPERAMGFCLFNNILVGSMHARAAYGLQRIAIVDFDVHHGNGTQAAILAGVAGSGMFYGSTHQWPFYPGTGQAVSESDILSIPLAPGSGGAEFRDAFGKILRRLDRFQPEFVFLSAGFDAHRDDYMAQLKLEEGDFSWATEELCKAAARLCQGRVVSVLEGGYDLPSLARSARAHVQALMAA